MNAPQPTPRRATYQDVLDAPPRMVAQVVHGALHLHPRPAYRHTLAHSNLLAGVHGPFDRGRGGPGGWLIMTEPEVHLGEDILVPDIGGWRRERLGPVEGDPAFFALAPDWACEVLSPSTRRLDLTEKRDIYAREGVGHLWLVDPPARTLEAFALRDGAWVLLGALGGDAAVRLAPFDAVEWPLSSLWPD